MSSVEGEGGTGRLSVKWISRVDCYWSEVVWRLRNECAEIGYQNYGTGVRCR